VAYSDCKNSSLRQRGPTLGFNNPVYRKKPFASKESDTKIVQSIYFACEEASSALIQIESFFNNHNPKNGGLFNNPSGFQ